MNVRTILALCSAWLVTSFAFAAPAIPEWLKSAEAVPTPTLPGDVPSYVLFTDATVTIGNDGVATEQVRYAVRVLTQRGDDDAVANLPYTEKSDKLISGTAWLIRGGKIVKSEAINKWLDICQIEDGTVFTEQRARVMSFPRETLGGDVFGFEAVKQRPMLFAHYVYGFDSGTPTAVQRIRFVLPAGWSLKSTTSGSGLGNPVVDTAKNTWTWSLMQRPHIPNEPWTPRILNDAPRLLISFVPPPGAKGPAFPRFDSWADVGSWAEQLGEGQCDKDAGLSAVTTRLAGEAESQGQAAVVRALCAHVQRLRYVAVNKGLGLGFGYKPRKATEVLARGYGDCKDKANLLRSMLREAGIESHMVLVESGWRYPTVREWPSPTQFNHAIIAIQVDETLNLPATITTTDGLRLLFFDPTDEYTVLGDLPWSVQGTAGLLVRRADSALVDVPALPPEEEWVYETKARLTVAANGSADGSADFIGRRQGGRDARAAMRGQTAKQLSESAARYMSSMLRGVVVRDPVFIDDTVTGEAGLRLNMSVPAVLQPGPGGMLMMRLDVYNRDSVPQLSTRERVQPIEVRPVDHREEVVFELPPTISIDDPPKPARVESAYGSYDRTVDVLDGKIVLRRRLQLRMQVVPAADYEKVRAFLTTAAKADKAAIVLRQVKVPAQAVSASP